MPELTKERMLEIEHVTEKLLTDIDFSQSPAVDIASLVKKDGFDVKPSLMPIETTGCLFVNDASEQPERLIMVNKVFKNPENEEDVVFKKSRFITAHEYGHYLLHKSPQQPLYAHRDSDKREEIQEKEADYFARSLLMPYEQFKSYTYILRTIGNDEDFTISMLSKLFKVTKNKVRKRITDLAVLE